MQDDKRSKTNSGFWLPGSEELDIGHLSRLFDNKSECYKLFWFQALIRKVSQGQYELTFEELVDQMILDAWYMVTEYHLNLGPSDTLEKAVHYICDKEKIAPAEKKERILAYLQNTDDKQVKAFKQILTYNVPYRLQAPFLETAKGFWAAGTHELTRKINQQKHLIYYFGDCHGLATKIRVQPEWGNYITVNHEILESWLRCDMIAYLQKRNPCVPGIVDKIDPPQERKLADVQAYWKTLIRLHDIHEIFDDEQLQVNAISIDHFIPWSYVAHDEFWNLHPTTKSINSSKSNYLPAWDRYFTRFSSLEYLSYLMMWQNEELHKKFDHCAREHLNNPEIKEKLYQQGLSKELFCHQLEDIIKPVYQSALQCGFKEWSYADNR